jgi:hypothetical protein
MRRRVVAFAIGVVALAALLWWLRDPPFAPRTETGLRGWTTGADGRRYRWTTGRASIFVDSSWRAVEIPLRAEAFSTDWLPVLVELRIDGKPVDRVTLSDEQWLSRRIVLDGLRTSRRFRRVDLRVNRTWSDGNYGVQLGEVRAGAPQ